MTFYETIKNTIDKKKRSPLIPFLLPNGEKVRLRDTRVCGFCDRLEKKEYYERERR
jgi:hypothetical protein